MQVERRVVAGAVIGGCVLEAEIGRGGMGVVWRARQRHPNRPVAVKLLAGGDRAIDGETIARFGREARLLAGVRHPAVVQIHASGIDGSAESPIPYIVMELVEGALPIVEYARRNNLPLRARIELLAQACEGIGAAHARGVIHRDIKPGNVLVDGAGAVRIVDFGIARPLEHGGGDETLVTQPGRIVGTPQYMSPEQFGDEPDAVDARSDVYALGLVAHELLSGRPPYDLSGVGLSSAVRIVCELPPERLSEANPACRGDLDAIVAKALAKDPQRRYATANEYAADLRRTLRGEPVSARRLTAAYQASVIVRRYPVATGATIGVSALVLGLLGLFAWQREVAARARDAAGIVAAALALQLDSQELSRELLNRVRASERGWVWNALARAAGPTSASWVPGYDYALASIAGGRRAYGVARDELVRYDFPERRGEPMRVGRIRLPAVASEEPLHPECIDLDASECGRLVAMQHVYTVGGRPRTRIRVWDADEERIVSDAGDRPAHSSPVALSGDGRFVFWIADDNTLRMTPLDGAEGDEERVPLPDDIALQVMQLDADPTGRWLAIGNREGRVAIVERAKRHVYPPLQIAAGVIRDLRWTPDGGRLLIAADDGRLVVLRPAEPEMPRDIVEFPRALRAVAVSRDGRTIAVVGADRVMRVLDADSLRIVHSASVSIDEAWSVALNADGSVALVGERGVRAIDIPTRIVEGPRRLAAFSRSGRSLVTVGPDERITVAELDEWQDPVSLRSWVPRSQVTAVSVRDGPSGPIVAARLADGTIELSGGPWLPDAVSITPAAGPGRRELPGSGSVSIALSEDLRTIVVGDPDNRVRFVCSESGRTLVVDPREYAIHPTNAEAGVRFVEEVVSDDTRAFLVVGDARQQLSVWPSTMPAASVDALATHPTSPIGAATVAGPSLFVGTQTGWLLRFELPALRLAWERQILASHVRAIAVHPEGSLLAAADDSQLWIVRASDGESIAPLARLSSRPLAMAFRDTPQQLLLLDADGILHVWNGDPAWPAPIEQLPVKPSPLEWVYGNEDRKDTKKQQASSDEDPASLGALQLVESSRQPSDRLRR